MPGAALTAMSMSTQSWNDAASTRPEPKRSWAHRIAALAGLCSSSADDRGELAEVDVDERARAVNGVVECRHRWPAVRSPRTRRRRLRRRTDRSRRSRRRSRGRRRGWGSGRGRYTESPTPLRAAGASEPVCERLAGLALAGEPADDPHDGFGRGLGRQLARLVAELDFHLAEVAAEQHLVAGRGAAVRAAFEAHEADVGDVVLAAAVRAARDVDAHAADLGEAGVLERVADRRREPARLRDREVARVGARARRRRRGRARRRVRPCRSPTSRS